MTGCTVCLEDLSSPGNISLDLIVIQGPGVHPVDISIIALSPLVDLHSFLQAPGGYRHLYGFTNGHGLSGHGTYIDHPTAAQWLARAVGQSSAVDDSGQGVCFFYLNPYTAWRPCVEGSRRDGQDGAFGRG